MKKSSVQVEIIQLPDKMVKSSLEKVLTFIKSILKNKKNKISQHSILEYAGAFNENDLPEMKTAIDLLRKEHLVLHVGVLRTKEHEVVLPRDSFPHLRFQLDENDIARAGLRFARDRPTRLRLGLRDVGKEIRVRDGRGESEGGECKKGGAHGL